MGLWVAGVKQGASSPLGEGSEAKPGQRGRLSGGESLRLKTLELGVRTFFARPCDRLLRSERALLRMMALHASNKLHITGGSHAVMNTVVKVW